MAMTKTKKSGVKKVAAKAGKAGKGKTKVLPKRGEVAVGDQWDLTLLFPPLHETSLPGPAPCPSSST